MKIPEKYLMFFRQVAELARANNLDAVTIKARPGFRDSWRGEISANWDQGRHGDDAYTLRVSSTVDLIENLDSKNKSAPTPKEPT